MRNRRQKKELVEKALAHRILVYAKGMSRWVDAITGRVKSCPGIDTKRNYRELSLGAGFENLWRISCFVPDKKHWSVVWRVQPCRQLSNRSEGRVVVVEA